MKAPKINTGVCANCGAEKGLHHYQTNQCPLHGIEETRDEQKQRWAETTFEDIGSVQLIAAAPDMAKALESVYRMGELIVYTGEVKPEHRGEALALQKMMNEVKAALLKAGYTE